jgi:hypothetical protein
VKHLPVIFATLLIYLGLILVAASYGQTGQNPGRDLAATNYGNMIMLHWAQTDGASEYVVYRSLSISGPWEVLYTIVSPPKGAMTDVTPDAMTMILCYHIDAKNSSGVVIHTYQPICVPKYVP